MHGWEWGRTNINGPGNGGPGGPATVPPPETGPPNRRAGCFAGRRSPSKLDISTVDSGQCSRRPDPATIPGEDSLYSKKTPLHPPIAATWSPAVAASAQTLSRPRPTSPLSPGSPRGPKPDRRHRPSPASFPGKHAGSYHGRHRRSKPRHPRPRSLHVPGRFPYRRFATSPAMMQTGRHNRGQCRLPPPPQGLDPGRLQGIQRIGGNHIKRIRPVSGRGEQPKIVLFPT
jgi:hypothetical protein